MHNIHLQTCTNVYDSNLLSLTAYVWCVHVCVHLPVVIIQLVLKNTAVSCSLRDSFCHYASAGRAPEAYGSRRVFVSFHKIAVRIISAITEN